MRGPSTKIMETLLNLNPEYKPLVSTRINPHLCDVPVFIIINVCENQATRLSRTPRVINQVSQGLIYVRQTKPGSHKVAFGNPLNCLTGLPNRATSTDLQRQPSARCATENRLTQTFF